MQLEYPQQDKPRNGNIPASWTTGSDAVQVIMICYAKRLGCFAKLAAH